MAVERYLGTYISAEDASKLIDIYTINDGVRMMRESSDKLETLAKKINLLAEYCNRDALSANGANMEEMVTEYERHTRDFAIYLQDLASALQTTSQRIFNRKQIIMNEEAKKLDKQEVLAHHHSVSTSSDIEDSTVYVDYAEGRAINNDQ